MRLLVLTVIAAAACGGNRGNTVSDGSVPDAPTDLRDGRVSPSDGHPGTQDGPISAPRDAKAVDGGAGCISDTQCSAGYYCNFKATTCPGDAGAPRPRDDGTLVGGISTALPGDCVRNCYLTDSCLNDRCRTMEDCAPAALCIAQRNADAGAPDVLCTRESPCAGGGACFDQHCGGILFQSCPPGCDRATPPHACSDVCICQGNRCP